MFVSYPVNPLLVRRCPFCSVLSFEHVQNFPPDKTDRRPFDVRSLCGLYAHKSIARVKMYIYDHKSSDEFYNGTNRTRTVRVVCP